MGVVAGPRSVTCAPAVSSPAMSAPATAGDETAAAAVDDLIRIPRAGFTIAPILSVVALQLLAYHIARLRGCEIDQPRNLAKSVTVE